MTGKLFNVGKIVNTHGIRGEMKVISQTDFPDVRFRKGSSLLLIDPDGGTTVPVVVESGRAHKNLYYLTFEGLHHINQVERFKGWTASVPESELLELEEDEYYYHEIIGCRVITEDGEELGTISEILSPGANDVWVVDRPESRQPLLLPVIDDVLVRVDAAHKTITVRLMEGLI